MMLIRAGTLIDGLGGPAVRADLLVSGGSILAVDASIRAPEGATVHDASGGKAVYGGKGLFLLAVMLS